MQDQEATTSGTVEDYKKIRNAKETITPGTVGIYMNSKENILVGLCFK